MQTINSLSGVSWAPFPCENSTQVLPKQCGYFCFLGMSDGLIPLILPGDAKVNVIYSPIASWIAGELYIATSANPPDGTAQQLTIESRATLQPLTSQGPKGRAGNWSDLLPASQPIWLGCRYDGSGGAGLQVVKDRAWFGTLRVDAGTAPFTVGAQLTTVGDCYVPHYRYSSA